MPRLLQQSIPIYYLRIEIEILRGVEHWNQMLAQLTHPPMPIVDDSETRAEELRLLNS
jgi:hypothetical protein